jgi:hypothetical protein
MRVIYADDILNLKRYAGQQRHPLLLVHEQRSIVMVKIHRISVSPPLINSSCAWASELHELEDLYNSAYTGAVTTRTATLLGFAEDSTHTVGATPM